MRHKKGILIIAISILVIVVTVSLPPLIAYARTVLTASTAKVTITPDTKLFERAYTLTGATGAPDPSLRQMPVRVISYTTPARSTMVIAPDNYNSYARGMLTVQGASQDETLPSGTVFTASNGVQVKTTTAVKVPAGKTVLVPAVALKYGASGNIAPFAVNTSYTWSEGTITWPLLSNPVTFVFCIFVLFIPCLFDTSGTPGVSADVYNAAAFTGGVDVYVRQIDIDAATASIVESLSEQAQAKMQLEELPGEQPAGSMACSPLINPAHAPSRHVMSLSASVAVKCKAILYRPTVVDAVAQGLLAQDAQAQLSSSYQLVGKITTTVKQIVVNGASVTFLVKARGTWVYTFNSGQLQQMARLIAGQPQEQARTLLLRQPGVSRVVIETFGGQGTALPQSPGDITLLIQSVG
jgi:hypothetical protein